MVAYKRKKKIKESTIPQEILEPGDGKVIEWNKRKKINSVNKTEEFL
jgi:hypothetical protein